jgi:hypothetical protein
MPAFERVFTPGAPWEAGGNSGIAPRCNYSPSVVQLMLLLRPAYRDSFLSSVLSAAESAGPVQAPKTLLQRLMLEFLVKSPWIQAARGPHIYA